MKHRIRFMAIIIICLLTFTTVSPSFADKYLAPPPNPPTESLPVENSITLTVNVDNSVENTVAETDSNTNKKLSIFDGWWKQFREWKVSSLFKTLIVVGVGILIISCVWLIILLVHWILQCVSILFVRRPWFKPRVIVSISTDGGNTYKENIRLIPIRNDGIVLAYVKFEIVVKTNELLAGKTVNYAITHDKRFELNDYIGNAASKGEEKPEDSFIIVASNRPYRAEIIYRCKYNKKFGTMLYRFDITFDNLAKSDI